MRFIATGIPIERIDPELEPGDLALLASFPIGFIYENPRAMPRVLFAARAQTVDFEALLRTGAWPDADLSQTVLLPRDDGASEGRPSLISAPLVPIGGRLGDSSETAPDDAAKLHVATYGNTEIIIDVDATTGGYLVLNDPIIPGGLQRSMGKGLEIVRANVLFRAVAVPGGRHKVRFAFRPLQGAWRQLVGRVRRWGRKGPGGASWPIVRFKRSKRAFPLHRVIFGSRRGAPPEPSAES